MPSSVKKLKPIEQERVEKTKRRSSYNELGLKPPAVNEPPTKLTDYGIVLFGEKGVGKTSLAVQFPAPWVFMFEPRRRNLRVRQVPEADDSKRLNWERARAYTDLFLSRKENEAKTLVIDTVDRAYQKCFDHICFNKGVKHPNQIKDFGQTWNEIKAEFEDWIEQILEAKRTPIFISHATYRIIPSVDETEDDNETEMIAPTCAPACWLILKAITDLVIYYGYSGVNRVMVVSGNENIWSANGIEGRFEGVTKILAPSVKEAYKNLNLAFDNKYKYKETRDEEPEE